MKAFFLTKSGDANSSFSLKETPAPKPGKGQVLIQTEGFGLNYADVVARHGLYRDMPPMPCILGYDVVGKVIETGEDADKNLIGKRVTALTRFGGYAELAVTDARAVMVIPDELSVSEATALSTQYVTAYYAAIERANLREGETVLLHAAAGGVGTALIQIAKSLHCKVFALVGSDEKEKYVRYLGADYVINYRKTDYEREVRKLLGTATLDVAFNSVAGATFKKDRRLLGVNGRSVLYGVADRSGRKFGFLSTMNVVFKMGAIVPVSLLMKTQSVTGLNMLQIADHKPLVIKRCMDGLMEMYHKGQIRPTPGTVFPANQLAEAHTLLESRKSTGKIAVKW